MVALTLTLILPLTLTPTLTPTPTLTMSFYQVIAQTMKAINAFEVTYNGHLLHSKLATSAFPQQHELHQRLASIMQAEESGAAASRPDGQQA